MLLTGTRSVAGRGARRAFRSAKKLSGCKNLRNAARVLRFRHTGYFSLVSSIPASSLVIPAAGILNRESGRAAVADRNYIA
jgi:hypothetical protein